MWRVLIAVLVIGGGVAYSGWQKFRLAGKVNSEPTRMSAADLAANGPGENCHIILTDFLFLGDLVYEQERGQRDWERCWNGVVPLDGPEAGLLAAAYEEYERAGVEPVTPRIDFQIIAECRDVSENVHTAIGETDEIRGIVVNGVFSPDAEAMRMLEQSYPHVETEGCWLFVVDHKVPETGTGLAMLGGGGVLSLGALAWMAFSMRRTND